MWYYPSVLNDTTKGGGKLDTSKLEEAMKQQNVSKGKICEQLGISRSAFYRKCNGKSEFTRREMIEIAQILNLSDISSIFFASEVS